MNHKMMFDLANDFLFRILIIQLHGVKIVYNSFLGKFA
jgi:hypothetical protein